MAADALDVDGGGAWRIQPPSLRVTPLPGTVPSLKRTVDAEAVTLHRLEVIGVVAAQVARQLGVEEGGSRIVINNGAGAGQTVFHLHVHVLAGRPLAWPPG